jgi:hypothetical protein
MAGLMRQLFIDSIARISSNSSTPDLIGALECLLTYSDNLSKSGDDKFRSIRIANIHFVERLGRLPGGIQSLEALGFARKDGFLVIDRDVCHENADEIRQLRPELEQRLREATLLFEKVPRIPPQHTWCSVRGRPMAIILLAFVVIDSLPIRRRSF